MSKKKGGPGEIIAWLGLAGIISYCQHAPRFMRYWAFRFLLKLAYLVLGGRVKMAVEHIRIAFPGETDAKLRKIVYRSFMNLADFCTEFCWMPEMTKETLDKYIRFQGFENLENAYKRGKGVVLVWAHYDHFEWVNTAIALKGYPVYTLIREVDNRRIDAMLDSMRESSGQKIIKREHSAAEIIKRLREGNIVTIAADQNALFNEVFVRFFGKWASTIRSPAVAHLRTGAPIIPVYSVREKDNSHTAYILPELEIPRIGDLKRDVVLITQAIADVQARFIAQRPELWLWIHRRWKIQPDKKEEAYYSGILSDKT